MSLIERSFREKIVLVGVTVPPASSEETDEHLAELALLVNTAGADEVARVVQRRDAPDPATYIGKGKAEELRELSLEVDADTVVFDADLSPAQSRNLEKLLGRTAIDRTAVILDIFAQNARTREGKAQVELAQLRYRLPRLRGRGLGPVAAGRRHRDQRSRRDPARGGPPAPAPAHDQARGRAQGADQEPAHPAQGRGPAAGCRRCPWSATPTPASRRCSTV